MSNLIKNLLNNLNESSKLNKGKILSSTVVFDKFSNIKFLMKINPYDDASVAFIPKLPINDSDLDLYMELRDDTFTVILRNEKEIEKFKSVGFIANSFDKAIECIDKISKLYSQGKLSTPQDRAYNIGNIVYMYDAFE